MKISIIAVGTHGDVQPHLALALGFRKAGHEVRFCTHSTYKKMAADRGVEVFAFGGADPRKVMTEVQQQTVLTGVPNRLFRHFRKRHAPSAEALDELVRACAGVDLVISGLGHAVHAAESIGMPYWRTALCPSHPTGKFPHHLLRRPRTLGKPLNRLSHWLMFQMFWQVESEWVNRWRTETLGLPRLGSVESCQRFYAVPCLYGFSRLIVPRPEDWGEGCHVTGFWFLQSDAGWEAPKALEDFLKAGPPPIAFGFGSIVDPHPVEFRQILQDAAAAAGVRSIVLDGWGGSSSGPGRADVFHSTWIPFQWLTPRLQMLVHHGGAGTCSEAVRAGVPSVTIPYSGEQRFWSSRLADMGAAPPPIPRAQLNVERLTQAIRNACSETMAGQTRLAGEALRNEDGVSMAVALVEKHCRHRGQTD